MLKLQRSNHNVLLYMKFRFSQLLVQNTQYVGRVFLANIYSYDFIVV